MYLELNSEVENQKRADHPMDRRERPEFQVTF